MPRGLELNVCGREPAKNVTIMVPDHHQQRSLVRYGGGHPGEALPVHVGREQEAPFWVVVTWQHGEKALITRA